jgi:uncharacterized membrane protein YphA (DoxX/SURF4 family)
LVALTLIAKSLDHLQSADLNLPHGLFAALSLIAGVCLLIGFLTPVVAVVIGLGAVAFGILSGVSYGVLAVIILATAIVLIGPGAFSIDARLFGHREILIPDTHRSKTLSS